MPQRRDRPQARHHHLQGIGALVHVCGLVALWASGLRMRGVRGLCTRFVHAFCACKLRTYVGLCPFVYLRADMWEGWRAQL